MSTCPTPGLSRRVTVKGSPTRLERMLISGRPYIVTNPGTYQPGFYRAELDPKAGTATIHELDA